MIEQLVSRVFYTRNAAHLAHWKTKSYAQHVALGAFYDGLIDNIDNIVEAYQGFYDLIAMVPPKPGEMLPKDIILHISDEADWINENRSKIADGTPAIENLIDNLSGLYLSTLYKLRNLS